MDFVGILRYTISEASYLIIGGLCDMNGKKNQNNLFRGSEQYSWGWSLVINKPYFHESCDIMKKWSFAVNHDLVINIQGQIEAEHQKGGLSGKLVEKNYKKMTSERQLRAVFPQLCTDIQP